MPASNSVEPEPGLVQPFTQPTDGLPPGTAVGIGDAATEGVAMAGVAVSGGVAVSVGDAREPVGRIVTLGTGVGLGVAMATGST